MIEIEYVPLDLNRPISTGHYEAKKYGHIIASALCFNYSPEMHLKSVIKCLEWVKNHTVDEFVSVNGRTIHMHR